MSRRDETLYGLDMDSTGSVCGLRRCPGLMWQFWACSGELVVVELVVGGRWVEGTAGVGWGGSAAELPLSGYSWQSCS